MYAHAKESPSAHVRTRQRRRSVRCLAQPRRRFLPLVWCVPLCPTPGNGRITVRRLGRSSGSRQERTDESSHLHRLRTSPLPTVIHLQSATCPYAHLQTVRIPTFPHPPPHICIHSPLRGWQCRRHGRNLDGYSCRNSSGIPPDSLAPRRLSHLQGYLNRRQSYNKSKRSVCPEGKF